MEDVPGITRILGDRWRSQASATCIGVTSRRAATSDKVTWVVHQLREAIPYDSSSKYLLFDRDTKFGFEVLAAVKSMGTKPVRTTFRSPWQKDYASYCTSWAPCATISFTSRRSDSFLPCAFRGGFLP
jgi:hypothetical protein